MPNKMLIDAAHPEETRVVVLRGNRVEEFDFESASRKQLRGNIYLAKVTRVEPSLQAAFIDYGGNRHGFLAFSEIHPDYYQIPVADRQALIEEEERAARAADAEADSRAGRRAPRSRGADRPDETVRSEPIEELRSDGAAMAAASEAMVPAAGFEEIAAPGAEESEAEAAAREAEAAARSEAQEETIEAPAAADLNGLSSALPAEEPRQAALTEPGLDAETAPQSIEERQDQTSATVATSEGERAGSGGNVTEVNGNGSGAEEDLIESVGGADAMEEVPERTPRLRRQYKIQEVIKRRQVMLVQVVKEERGTKGAALTTYLSLAGRYSVLMPNTARGGGISRKITDAQDRRRLKELAQELEVPEGMGVILRTAGASRTKTEIKRDFEYLLRLWETVRDFTLKSTAPTLVYEEGSLVKRSIRDLYNKDIDEILVAGDEGYREAREFMRMLMPSHARSVRPFRDPLPIFTRFGIESQLDAMFQPVVQLRSGGYIVLNQTEALVAIDVNSGRATREHHIEDTALKTNLEAAEEIARQLRLRDLAGLIVIDFIDMDEKRNNRTVERRLKEALKNDRARIQVGHISHFGLLEMSRQRIRSSVLESSTEKCPNCGGSGHIRSVSSVALQLLRALEEMLLKGATHNLVVRTRTEIALYLLNLKRAHLRSLEERFQIAILVNADAGIGGQLSYVIEKSEQVHSLDQARAIAAQAPVAPAATQDDEYEDEDEDFEEEEEGVSLEGVEGEEGRANGGVPRSAREEGAGERGGRKRRRRRRARRGEGREVSEEAEPVAHRPLASEAAEAQGEGEPEVLPEASPGLNAAGEEADEPSRDDGERRRRRRGRRGGRRNRRDRDGEVLRSSSELDGVATSDAEPGEPEFESADAPRSEETPTEPRFAETGARHEAEAEVLEQDEPVSKQIEAATVRSKEPTRAEASLPLPPPPAEIEPHQRERKSTVREPARASSADEGNSTAHWPPSPPPEPPQPMPSSQTEGEPADPEPADRPRRSGWWNRRVLGKS